MKVEMKGDDKWDEWRQSMTKRTWEEMQRDALEEALAPGSGGWRELQGGICVDDGGMYYWSRGRWKAFVKISTLS